MTIENQQIKITLCLMQKKIELPLQSVNCVAIPRIGETIVFQGAWYEITSVRHDFDTKMVIVSARQ